MIIRTACFFEIRTLPVSRDPYKVVFAITVIRREKSNKEKPKTLTNPAYIGKSVPTKIKAKSENETIGCQHNGSEGITWTTYHYYYSDVTKGTPQVQSTWSIIVSAFRMSPLYCISTITIHCGDIQQYLRAETSKSRRYPGNKKAKQLTEPKYARNKDIVETNKRKSVPERVASDIWATNPKRRQENNGILHHDCQCQPGETRQTIRWWKKARILRQR